MPVNVLRVADRVAGSAIERLTSAHHARRLNNSPNEEEHVEDAEAEKRLHGEVYFLTLRFGASSCSMRSWQSRSRTLAWRPRGLTSSSWRLKPRRFATCMST